MKLPVVAIGGPTASGKTALAKNLLAHFKAVAISVDSTQVYQGLDIGAGKDLSFEQKMIDILKPEQPFSVSEYANMALREIKTIHLSKKLPILVGGTGYYLDSLLFEKTFPNATNPALVNYLDKLSTEELSDRLEKLDSHSADRVGLNRRRLIRSLEIVETTGQPVPLQSKEFRFKTLLMVLDPGVEEVDRNIIVRLEERLKEGLISEVRQLKKNVDNEWLAGAGIEYNYISLYLDNKLSYNSMFEHIVGASQAYARRQRTWWRRYPEAIWIVEPDKALKLVKSFLN